MPTLIIYFSCCVASVLSHVDHLFCRSWTRPGSQSTRWLLPALLRWHVYLRSSKDAVVYKTDLESATIDPRNDLTCIGIQRKFILQILPKMCASEFPKILQVFFKWHRSSVIVWVGITWHLYKTMQYKKTRIEVFLLMHCSVSNLKRMQFHFPFWPLGTVNVVFLWVLYTTVSVLKFEHLRRQAFECRLP